MSEPLPAAYLACLSVSPVSRASSGSPSTTTVSVKLTLIAIRAPMPYVSVALGDDTDRTVGSVVSIAMGIE